MDYFQLRKPGIYKAWTPSNRTGAILAGLLVLAVSAGATFAGTLSNKTTDVTIQVNHSRRTTGQNNSVSYPVSLTSNKGFSDTVTPTVSGLPANTTAAFAPASVVVAPGKTATVLLTVVTADSPPEGKAELTIATAAGTNQAAGVAVQLDVQSSGRTLTFSGDLGAPLSPGSSVPLNLSIYNPNNETLSLNGLSVSITDISRTEAAVAAELPCTRADYAISNYTGPHPLTIPAGHNSLQSLEIPPALWPKIAMLDTTLNQDGCKGATLQLAYSQAAEGN
ncbi:hypothetical protein QFZ40_001077 [Arthrobacter pascens]|uniref:COG1470 family protein n=1 Tax=Arthrobacter pascens TaxID=1677 RepID=UPI0027834E1F|nr:hypothetical protein [Arthrobacter pascens]MDQ0633168.1 hypothetical protein [Arthrobacter pascens]